MYIYVYIYTNIYEEGGVPVFDRAIRDPPLRRRPTTSASQVLAPSYIYIHIHFFIYINVSLGCMHSKFERAGGWFEGSIFLSSKIVELYPGCRASPTSLILISLSGVLLLLSIIWGASSSLLLSSLELSDTKVYGP